jgi:hypothetical protein
MQVLCPICGKVGLLQEITPRYYRVRHSVVKSYIHPKTRSPYKDRSFTYCRVLTEWALQQIEEEKTKKESELNKILFGR